MVSQWNYSTIKNNHIFQKNSTLVTFQLNPEAFITMRRNSLLFH